MQGLILAAGMGKRLQELTKENTKCMVEVCGTPLIDRTLAQLDTLGLSRIVIVIGYEGQKLVDHISGLDIITPVIYVENPIYDRTNNIYSLLLAKEQLVEDDTLLLESDIIFEEGLLQDLVEDPRPSLALVDAYESWMDGTCVTLDDEDRITSFVSKADFDWSAAGRYFKTVNIYKFSREFSQNSYVPFMTAYCETMGMNQYYEQVLKVIALLGDGSIRAKRLENWRWYEIDDAADLDIAESLFDDDEGRLARVMARYGGYWRYPKLLDFCYLVNPYYPDTHVVNELQANFPTLLTQYPSGMKVNSLLAAKNFGVRAEHILVGNGAAELIKALTESFTGRLGVVRPTFEEYPNRYDPEKTVVFRPGCDAAAADSPEGNAGLRYTADDLTAFFGGRLSEGDALILIDPDNPSGNYIPREDVLRLAAFCEERKIRLIFDESFLDFADEPWSLFDEEIFAAYPHLMAVKSISKSYGVPGLRLGVLGSGDEELIARLKKDVAIWNINSFGEYFLQIEGKHHGLYLDALKLFREERARYVEALSALPGLTVYPTQANYVMCRLTGGVSAHEITKRLLSECDILIKDLTPKMAGRGEFLRLAVRNREDNDRLVKALSEYLRG